MYHKIREQEEHPENYFLKEIDPGMTEDECFDLMSKPRQTQRTIGLYLKKIKGRGIQLSDEDEDGMRRVKLEGFGGERSRSTFLRPRGAKESPPAEEKKREKKRFPLTPGSHDLEREVQRNKGFWVGRPELSAPLIYKMKEMYSVDVEQDAKGEQGIFYRPKQMDLDYLVKMAKAGLLYPEEEFSDSEEEIKPDETSCLPLRKTVYKICDPCKEKKEKKEEEEAKPPKDLVEELRMRGVKPPFKKIPTGCDCDFYGDHRQRPRVWDYPFDDEVDMLRQHEMNKVFRPYKHELLNKYYDSHPPVKFTAHESGMKRTFPVYQISNL